MPRLYGIDIVISRDQPGYKLPADLPLPPKFREEFDAWAASFFKPKPSLIRDGEVIHDKVNRRMYMNERMWDKLRIELMSVENANILLGATDWSKS